MTIQKESMDKVFRDLDGEVAILLQRSPDPDAMGSAAGFKLLLDKVYGLDAKVYHYGEISHPQNKSMKNVLRISLADGSKLDTESTGIFVVLDTDLSSTGFKKSKKIKRAQVRIDHHTMDRDAAPDILDVRQTGSCAAIIWDYLKEYEIDLTEHADVATALVLGIETDTLHFTSSNTSELDYEAYRHLLPLVDKIALAKLNKFTLPKMQFETEVKAFNNLTLAGSIATSYVGELTEHSRDLIPTIADRFARMETVSTVVIMGIVDNHLIASVRSDDSRHDVTALCAEAFGEEFSGAKEGSGGARVPLGVGFGLLEGDLKEQALEKMIEGFHTNILKALGE